MEINQRIGNFQINFFIIDKYGDIMSHEPKLVRFFFKKQLNFSKTSIYQSRNRNFLNKLMEFFWIKNPSNNMEIDVPLMENLPNNVET